MSGSKVSSRGDITIDASIDVTSSAPAGGGFDATKKGLKDPLAVVPFSAGFARAEGSAQALIDGNSMFVAGGSVSITSDAKLAAEVQSLTMANAVFGNKSKYIVNGTLSLPSVSIAVTDSDTTSKALVGQDVQISAKGDVTVHAKADVTNDALAGTSVFGDGWGSIGYATGTDITNVLSRVDGRITSGGTVDVQKLDLSSVNEMLDTFRVPDHGLKDGQMIVYHAATPPDPSDPLADPDPLDPIGGLTDGQTYFVIVKDKDTFQLAEAPSLALDASEIGPEVMNSLSRRAVKTAAGNAIDLGTDILTLAGHGFSEFQPVTPVTTSDWTLSGLDGQASYVVHVVDADHIQLLTLIKEPAGTIPRELSNTGYYIVDLALAPPASVSDPAVTPQGILLLGYDEAAKVFNAAESVKNGSTLEIAGHGLQTGDAVTYNVLQSAQPAKVNVARTALFSPADIVFRFDPNGTAQKVADNTILLDDGQPFVTGQRVTYSVGAGGTPIGGLLDGADYFVIEMADGLGIQLASTQDGALNRTFIPLTSTGSGSEHVLRSNAVDVEENQLVLRDHQLVTGQKVVYYTDGGAAVGGLTPGETYYAIRSSDHVLQLARTRQDASAGNAIDFTSGAGGSKHSLTTDTFVSMVDMSRTKPVVDYTENTIELPVHGLSNGDRISYDPLDGEAIGGLAKGDYAVIVVDADHIRLAPTVNASAPIDLLPRTLETGAQEFTIGDRNYEFDPLVQPTINMNNDTIWMRNHGFAPGEHVTYLTGGALRSAD